MLRRILAISAIISFLPLTCIDNGAFGEPDKNINEWNPPSAGPVTTWTAPLCGKGKLVVQPFFFYNRTRGTFDNDSHYDRLPEGNEKYQYQEQLFAQYGLTDRLELDAQAVYQQNYAKEGDLKAHSGGFGDTYLFARYCFFEEAGRRPHIAGIFQVKAPTGKYQHADPDRLGTDLMGATSGGGSWDEGAGLIFTKKLKPFVAHCDFVYSVPQEVKVNGVKTRYANYLNYDFGVEYFMPKGFNLMFEANGFLQSDKKENGNKLADSDVNYLTVSPGVGWSCERIQTLLAYQRVLTGTNTDANDSVVFTFVYSF